MERDLLLLLQYRREHHFNSHAHVERDVANHWLPNEHSISTHTLTWSVTILDIGMLLTIAISTHTLTWSVTCVRFQTIF